MGTRNMTLYPNATQGPHMYFSSATVRLDKISSYITNTTSLFLDAYPTFVFDRLNTESASYYLITMSSFLQYGQTILQPMNETFVFAQNKLNNFGNLFQQPLKLQFAGSDIANKYNSNYVLCHNLISSFTFNLSPGFITSSVQIRYGSVNSLFLTVQNLP